MPRSPTTARLQQGEQGQRGASERAEGPTPSLATLAVNDFGRTGDPPEDAVGEHRRYIGSIVACCEPLVLERADAPVVTSPVTPLIPRPRTNESSGIGCVSALRAANMFLSEIS